MNLGTTLTWISRRYILEKNGYIVRKTDEKDCRGRRIFITEKSKAIQPELYERFSEWSKILLKGFSEKETEMVYSIIGKMMFNAKEALGELDKDEEKK